MLGIEHFYVYDNNSTDGLLPRLRRYMDAGIVTYIWWPYRYEEGMRRNQVQAQETPGRTPGSFKTA
jgi:hypothetical protein